MNAIKLISRSFRKNRRLNLINISSMALGIAVTIIISGYLYQEFNYDMQFENSNRIFRILNRNTDNELYGTVSHGPLADALQNNFPEIESAQRVSFYYGYLALTAGENMYNEKSAIFADPDFFNMFLFPMEKGDATKCLESPTSIVISKKAALKYFGDVDPLGKQIKIGNDKTFTVSGVYKNFPKNSNFNGDIILPLEIISELTQVWVDKTWKYPTDINTFVLLEANANSEEVSKKIRDFQFSYVEEEPEEMFLQPLKSFHTEKDVFWESTPQANKSYLFFLAVVALVVLMMSGANFLLLYIGTASQRILNTGVKKFCGATKSNIFREHIKEISAYIALSTFAAFFIFYFYNQFLAIQFSFLPAIVGFKTEIVFYILLGILAFTAFISILPAIIISSQNPARIFKTSQKSLIGRSRLVNILVTGQFTLSIILLAVTALFYKQILFLERHDPGYAKEELITIPLNMHIGEGFFNENLDVFSEELKKQVGVKNVTLSLATPSVNRPSSGSDFDWEGKPEGKKVLTLWNSVYYDYFETLGLEITQGRSFNRDFPGDMINYDDGRKCAYILNEKAIEEMELENPIGKIFRSFGDGPIVGVVENFNFKSLHSEIQPMCFCINPFYFTEIIVRINPQVTNVLDNIETVWKEFVPDYPLEFSYVTDQLDKMYESENNLTASLNTFATMAILIACMGLLALTILSMQKRTKEIGIRKVNGAKVKELLAMLNKDFIKCVAIAFIVACPIAWYTMSKWLETFAFKTEISWWIFALAGMSALFIALLTVSWNSFRTANKNPVEALRYE